MAQQQFYRWYLDLRSGETKSQMYAVKADDRAWLTGAVLVDPPSVAAGRSVRVALCPKTGDDQISLVLSAERPVAALPSAVILDDDFWLEREDDDSADTVVRFHGCFVQVLATPATETVPVEEEEEDGEDQEAVFDEVDEDDGEAVGPEDDEDEEITEERVLVLTVPEASGDGDEDDAGEEFIPGSSDDGEFDVSVAKIADLLQMVHPSNFVAGAPYNRGSAPRVTAAGNTAGFMCVVAESDADIQGGDRCENHKHILVHYRYNCFSAASLVGGVEACGIEQRVQLLFIAAGGIGARSLEWAGALLAPLIYPGHSSYLLRELWSSLIADVNIPVHATHVEVFVDAGILRPADCTPERIEHMVSTLEGMMAKPWEWDGGFHAELHLPEPVRCVTAEDEANDDTDYEERPAKRRRVVATGENCSVCLELLEGEDLAAWPGCGKPHVFHATCLKRVLEKNTTCPICRRNLYIEPEFYLQ